MAVVAGQRRGSTALDRLWSQTLPGTMAVLPNQPDFDWKAVEELPGVASLATFALSGTYAVKELGPDYVGAMFPLTGDQWMTGIERPVVMAGRVLDPARPDEVVVSPDFVSQFGLGVGDKLVVADRAPALGSEPLEVVEQDAGGRLPLRGDDLCR